MFELQVLLKNDKEINESPIPCPCEQHHHHLIGEKQIIGEGICEKVNEPCSCCISRKPVWVTERIMIIAHRIGPGKYCKNVVDNCKQHVKPIQLLHKLQGKPW
jgi:hypothetical protein